MRFLHHPEAGRAVLQIEGEAYRHLFRARRQRIGELLYLRNLEDDELHTYRVVSVDRRRGVLELVETRNLKVAPKRFLHLGWCFVDPKIVERTLPALNEIGVGKITFLRCDRSQGNYRYERQRLERIVRLSSQQCGRSTPMELAFDAEFESFVAKHPRCRMLDFSARTLPCGGAESETLLIGCEGGWSDSERALLSEERIVGLDTPMILRSETAACAAAARILLGP